MSKETKKLEFSVEEALAALKKGRMVQRKSWGGSYVLKLQKNFGIRAYRRSIDRDLGVVEVEHTVVYSSSKGIDGEKQLSYSLTLADLLAEDWVLGKTVEELEEERQAEIIREKSKVVKTSAEAQALEKFKEDKTEEEIEAEIEAEIKAEEEASKE